MLLTRLRRMRKRVLLAAAILALVAVETVVVALFYLSERVTLRRNQSGFTAVEPVSDYWYPYPVPGLVRPPVVPASAAGLDDAEEVIGVEVRGKTRAYRIKVMRDRSQHVINDLIDGIPVTVCYCDLSDCIRGYTDAEATGPLDVAVAGLNNGEMVIKSGGNLFVQKTGHALKPGVGPPAIPLRTYETIRMTWKEWKLLHPDSDVYAGDPRP